MVKYLYDGNLNEEVNHRKKGDLEYYIRGTIEVDGHVYERYGIKTHFIEVGEDYVELVKRYVVPFVEEGDIVSVSEKVIAMCQNNIVHMEDLKLSWLTKVMSKCARPTVSGPGVTQPYKLQLMVNMKGWPKVIYAGLAAALGKLVGKHGVFYEILGADAAGIDGFYADSSFDTYKTTAVLMPSDPKKVCEEIYEQTKVQMMIVDANDISVDILGTPCALNQYSDQFLQDIIRDNPAGQDDELTPFIVIRDITGKEPQPYVPKKPKEA